MTPLQDALRNARIKKGLTFREIEKLSDGKITSVYCHLIEKGGKIPAPEKLRVLSKVLRINFLDLMLKAGHVEKHDLVIDVQTKVREA